MAALRAARRFSDEVVEQLAAKTLAGFVAGVATAAMLALRSQYRRVETVPTYALLRALEGRVLCLRPGLFAHRDVLHELLVLDLDRLYRVKTPTWSGFVRLEKTPTLDAARVLETVDTREHKSRVQLDSSDRALKDQHVLVFFVRDRHLGGLRAFVASHSAPKAVTQVTIRDAAQMRMLTQYIVNTSGPDRLRDFELVVEDMGRLEPALKKDVRYSFAFPDGTLGAACRVRLRPDHYHGGSSDGDDPDEVLLVSLVETNVTGVMSTSSADTVTNTDNSTQRLLAQLESVREAAAADHMSHGRPLNLYTPVEWGRRFKWRMELGTTPSRDAETLYLAGGTREALVRDLDTFLKSADRYARLGVPHRRGYLLHGPPGTGKTSLIRTIAGLFGMGLCIVNFTDLKDSDLEELMASAPKRCLIVMEDLDHMFPRAVASRRPRDVYDEDDEYGSGSDDDDSDAGGRVHRKKGSAPLKTRVTLAGLLNALDGLAIGKTRVVFMSTNHLESLPANLVRPGRCDVKLLLGHLTPPQARAMAAKFFPCLPEEDLDALARAVDGGRRGGAKTAGRLPITPADLQAYLLTCETQQDVVPGLAHWLE